MFDNYDNFDGNVSPENNDSFDDSRLNDFIARKAKELKIQKIGHEVSVFPTERNGNTAIGKATVVLDDQREVTKFHCICGHKRKIDDVERLVSESLARSTMDAIKMVEQLPASSQGSESVPAANGFFPAATPQQQKQFKHRQDKEISPKQLETICDMARKKRLHPESYVKDHMGGLELKKLNSAQANEVIQALMKVKSFNK